MDREILFRGLTERGEWVYGDNIITTDIATYDKHWCCFEFTKSCEMCQPEIIGDIHTKEVGE